MNPKITVIISTWNRPDTLQRAIRSVLRQSFTDLECIVVDDCSDNDVPRIVSSFKDDRLKYLRTDKNHGHDGPAKNYGIRKAQGEYIAFLDDDDEFRADALKILLTYAQETKADVTYGDYLNREEGKRKASPGWSVEFSASRLQRHNFIAMSVVLCRTEALRAVGGFDEDVPKFKDWNLWIRLQKNGAGFVHVPIIVTEVHLQKESVSTRHEVKYREDGTLDPTFFDPVDCLIWPVNTSLGARRPLRVAVYTLTMNRLEYTKTMAQAMTKTAGYPFDWYIIDQGSEDGTKEWLKEQTRDPEGKEGHFRQALRYRIYEKNVGLGKGWNQIVEFVRKYEEYDFLVKVDNDAQFLTMDWLKAMVEIYERNRNVCLSPYVEGLDGSPGGVMRRSMSTESPYMILDDKVLGLVPHLGGIVYATPVRLWKDFRFDEEHKGNFDVLLSQHAKANGMALFYCEEYRVWHIDGTKGQAEKFPEYFKNK